MYSSIKSLSLSRLVNNGWKKSNLSALPLNIIYQTYLKVYVELTHPSIQTPVWIDMDDYAAECVGLTKTLAEWLVDIGDRALNHIEEPKTEPRFIRYNDAMRCGYAIKPVKAGYDMPANASVYDLPDVALTRPLYPTDMSMLHTDCLVTVNGLIHMTDTDGKQAFVYDANKSLIKSNHNQLGIISFAEIGQLTKERLKVENIFNPNVDKTLKDCVYFRVDADTTDASFFLVLSGYMVFPKPGLLWKVSDNVYALDLNELPYVERIYDASLYIDVGIGLSKSHINEHLISLQEAYSDDVIKRYFTMSQSFFVKVDVPRLCMNLISIQHCNLPGVFTAYQEPTYPLLVSYGKFVEYWKSLDDGYWSVTVQDSFIRNYILSEQSLDKDKAFVTQQLNTDDLFAHSRGFLVEILGYEV